MNLEKFINIVKPFTMTSTERIRCLYESLEYVRENNIQGDLVECGVWKGGNVLGMMEYLSYYKITNKKVWLYDTFEGMTSPEDVDVDLNNNKAKDILHNVMCVSSLDEVVTNLSQSNFTKENVKYVIGDICETLNIKNNIPDNISILRLDTDWYKSTKKELEILYPKLTSNGVLIVDDYGHWSGSKKAVDEYFQNNIKIEAIDYTGIKIIKK